MILARTLRRTFTLLGSLPDPCVAFLRADPVLPHAPERDEIVEITRRHDGLLSMECSWGGRFVGSGRALVRAFDNAFSRLAAADEGATPRLNGTVLRFRNIRLLLLNDIGINLCGLTVALIARGAAYEGTSLIFLRPSGVIPHPVKPRVRIGSFNPFESSIADIKFAELKLDIEHVHCAVDPTFAGTQWTVAEGPIDIFIFVDHNEGGRPAIAPVGPQTALSRLIRNVNFSRKPSINDFAALKAIQENAASFRVTMGDVSTAAALVEEQIEAMRR